MKITYLAVIILGLFLVQCDTPEKRKAKAKDVIEKHLFETLDNYQSYESISLDIDTLNEVWIANRELREYGDELATIINNGVELESQIFEIERKFKTLQKSVADDFLFNSSRFQANFWSNANRISNIKNELDRLNTEKQRNDSLELNLRVVIKEMYESLAIPSKPYWLVTNKFRYSDTGLGTKIHNIYYIFDNEIKEIIFSWDDNDININNSLNFVRSIVTDYSEDYIDC